MCKNLRTTRLGQNVLVLIKKTKKNKACSSRQNYGTAELFERLNGNKADQEILSLSMATNSKQNSIQLVIFFNWDFRSFRSPSGFQESVLFIVLYFIADF